MLNLLGLGGKNKTTSPLGNPFMKDSVTEITITVRKQGNWIDAHGEKVKANIHFSKDNSSAKHTIADDDYNLVITKLQNFLESLP